MADALENQIMLQRLFAPTTEPLERLGQGQLALAQQNMLRQQALSDQARAIIEAGRVRKETQDFQAEEAKKHQTFLAGESTKSQIAQELRSYEDNVQAYNRLLKGAELTSAENKANREALVNQQKLQADTAKELESIRSEHQKQYLRMNAELEKEGRQAILAGQMDANTATFWALNELEKSQQQFIDNEYKVDIKDKNKIVRQIVESHKNYGKNTDKLNKWLDPNSTSNISLSLSRVVDPKDLRTIQQDIDAAMDRYLVPQRVRAQKAQDFIEANMRLKAEAMSRPGGVNLKQLQDYLGVRGGGALPRELTDYLDRNKPPGAVGGAAAGPPSGRDMFNAAAGVARQPMGPPAPTETGSTAAPVTANQLPPEYYGLSQSGLLGAAQHYGPSAINVARQAIGSLYTPQPIARMANAAGRMFYGTGPLPTAPVVGGSAPLNLSPFRSSPGFGEATPLGLPSVSDIPGAPIGASPMARLPAGAYVPSQITAPVPMAIPSTPAAFSDAGFEIPVGGMPTIPSRYVPGSQASPFQPSVSPIPGTEGISPKLFLRMRQLAKRENPTLTDIQINEGLERARQGDPQAQRVLNHYKTLAIQSLAAEGGQPMIQEPSF